MDPFESMFRWAWQHDFGESPEATARRIGKSARRTVTPAMFECDLSTSHFNITAQSMLTQFKAELIRQAKLHKVDGRAIAGAIAWEYEQNPRGRLSDWLQAPAKSLWVSSSSDGVGWGSMHGAEAQSLRPDLDDTELMCARMEARPALALIAEFMSQMAQLLYDGTNGVWIRDQPAALAGYYQAGRPLVQKTIQKQKDNPAASGPVQLNMASIPMARWVQTNLPRFQGYRTTPAVANPAIRVVVTT